MSVPRKVIVVLGMHRSGTSAITRALSVFGVNLGNTFHPRGFDNPKGFWEDKSVLEINEQLLAFMNSKYNQLDFAWNHFENNSEINNLKLGAKKFLTKRLNESDNICGFKDPRFCRLLKFWEEIFQDMGCKVSYVISIRNPMSIAKSLKKRNDIPEEKSYFLWLNHILPAVLDTSGKERVVVNYDNLIDEPYKQLERISSALGLPLPPRDSNSVVEYEKEFLSTALRHTKFSLSELRQDNRAPACVVKIFKVLSSVSNDQEKLESSNVINSFKNINDDLLNLSPIISYINILENEQIRLNNHVNSLSRTNAKFKQTLNEFKQTLTDRDNQLNEIHSSKSWRLTRPLRNIDSSLRRYKNNFNFRTSNKKKQKNNNNLKKYLSY